MEMKFFRAARGEGKTKWLLERAIEARNAGMDLWYIGSSKTMESLYNMWKTELHELCPIKNAGELSVTKRPKDNCCFLTDNFLDNVGNVGFWKSVVDNIDGVWYITMDKECFVN